MTAATPTAWRLSPTVRRCLVDFSDLISDQQVGDFTNNVSHKAIEIDGL